MQKRWALIRQGKMQEAVDLALRYTPFPATVCGYLCPNLCMQHCTRQTVSLPPCGHLGPGPASLTAQVPQPKAPSGRKVAVIGGGAGGLSVAWQLRMAGHEATIYEAAQKAGRQDHRLDPQKPDPGQGPGPRTERLRRRSPISSSNTP